MATKSQPRSSVKAPRPAKQSASSRARTADARKTAVSTADSAVPSPAFSKGASANASASVSPKHKDKWRALELTALLVAVLVFAVLGAVHFEQQLSKINWKLVGFIAGVIAAVFAVYWWQAQGTNSYDLIDMVMSKGKADLDKHLTVFSFALAVWLIVQQALEKQPVTELMLGVLGFFVFKRGAQGFSDALQNRPASHEPSQNVNVLQGANVLRRDQMTDEDEGKK